MSEGKVTLSVIVPSYNAASTIEVCLTSLINQEVKDPYEIIVVDSSEDETTQIIAEKFPSVRLIHLKEHTFPMAARDLGLMRSSGQLIAMIDADCVAAPDLLAKMLERHKNGNYVGVGGALRNGTPWSITGTIGYLCEFSRQLPSTKKSLTRALVTANVCYRREVLELFRLPEYRERGDDALLNWKICSSGLNLLFDPAIQVTHLNKTGLKAVKLQYRLGHSQARARKTAPDLPGSIFAKYPILGLSLPLVRLLLVTGRLISYRDWKNLTILSLLFPMFMAGALVWAWGFVRGAITEESQKPT